MLSWISGVIEIYCPEIPWYDIFVVSSSPTSEVPLWLKCCLDDDDKHFWMKAETFGAWTPNVLKTKQTVWLGLFPALIPERTSRRHPRSRLTMMSRLGEPAGGRPSHVTQETRKTCGGRGAGTRKIRNATCTEYDTNGAARYAKTR